MPKVKLAKQRTIENWIEKTVPLEKLRPYERNPRRISVEAYERLKDKLQRLGYHQRIICTHDLRVIGGHQRIKAMEELGMVEVNVLIPPRALSKQEFRELLVSDNLPFGEFDFDILAADFTADELIEFGMPESWLHQDIEGSGDGDSVPGLGSLADKFMIPPFSVFNAREGWWQERKQAWISLGIHSEEGRAEEVDGKEATMQSSTMVKSEWMKRGPDAGGSIFDPVLCEIAYRWFSMGGGTVLDPFAGGSVRGVVASRLDRQYVGVDLRKEQVAANKKQAKAIGLTDCTPVWHCGDSHDIAKLCKGVQADLLFTCPPYAGLEVYSDDTRDISTMAYPAFLGAYRAIIAASCALLKDDRFAVIVVGEVRDKKGNYYDFVGDTVQAFRDAGLSYYNEAILVTAVGSLPTRIGKQFTGSRKLGKTHQNVLVFLKGDAKKAAAACGEVEMVDMAESLGVEEA